MDKIQMNDEIKIIVQHSDERKHEWFDTADISLAALKEKCAGIFSIKGECSNDFLYQIKL